MSFVSGISVQEVKMDVPNGAIYGIWLTCASPSGRGRKDWIGYLTNTQVISQFGPTNRVNQERVLCESNNRALLERKIREKLGKGYVFIGHYQAQSKSWNVNGQGPTSSPVSTPPPAPKAPPTAKPKAAPKPAPKSEQDTVLSKWIADDQGEDQAAWF